MQWVSALRSCRLYKPCRNTIHIAPVFPGELYCDRPCRSGAGYGYMYKEILLPWLLGPHVAG